MSRPRSHRRSWSGRRSLIGATVLVAFVVVSLLTLGAASGSILAQHKSGDASAGGSAKSSTHLLSRAQGHASSVSRSSGSTASRSATGAGSALSQNLASTGCGIGGASDGSLADQTGFEDADGNLAPDTAGCSDWNSFSPTWNGRVGNATLGPLSFVGLTDPVNSTADDIYAGGVKQDTECPGTVTGKANDKADLARIYAAGEQIGGTTYLFLAWERQLDTTVQSDVFVSFEFNQGKVSCGSGSPFVHRTPGDLLFVYNFQSGNSTIDASKWDGSTWQPLPALPQEALVNSGNVVDTLGPGSDRTLTKFEFGEAGVNLSGLDLAGGGGKACETFGNVYGETRTSKSGDTAQLKDFAGPGPLDISNCVKPTIDTTLHNAADDSTIDNGTVLPLNTSVYDTATLGNLVAGDPTGTLNFTFFHNGDCSGPGTPAGTGVALGGQSDPTGPLGAGDYSFEAQYISGDDPNYTDSDVSSCEPFSVLKGSPTITTDATPKSGDLSSNLQDSALLSNGSNYDGTGNVTFYLYAPGVDCQTDGSGATYSESAGSVSDNGSFSTSTGFGPPLEAGIYHWLAIFSGDANNNPANSGCQEEPVVITASPSIATTPTPSTGSVGDLLNDTATLSGGSNYDKTGTITFNLFGPNDPTCDGQPAYTEVVAADHNGSDYSTTNATFQANEAGTWNWTADFSGDSNNNPAHSGCGEESVVITASPSITTTPSETSGSVGDVLNDSATLSGGSNFDGTGTITFSLYGPSDPTCDGEPAYTEKVTANHNGSDYATSNASFKANAPGTWNWTADFSGDSNNNPAHSGCGEESVLIKPASIHILKKADAATVNVGSQIGFTMTVYNDGGGDARGVKLNDTLPVKPGLAWTIASQGAGWANSCHIALGVLTCGGTNGATVPAGTTLAASTFTVHIVSGTTGATGGDCPNTGKVDNTGFVTTTNDGNDHSPASTCVQALVDLSVTKSGSPASQTLGDGNITWTMVVTNHGPSADTGVTIADPMPSGNTFVSATSSKGSCTGGAILNCTIGDMAAGESVTITLVTTPSTVGEQVNTVHVVGNRPETNTANNTATATVRTVGVITPPVFCVAVSKVAPQQLFVGRKTWLTIHVTQNKKAVKGVHVLIKGPKLLVRTKASNSKGVIKQQVKMKKAGILVFTPIASKRCNTKRVGVTNVFTPPVTG